MGIFGASAGGPLRVLSAQICEDAAATKDGKLQMKGVFHDLYAADFPAQQDRMTLVVVLEWDTGDQGRYAFQVNLADHDGRRILTVEGHSDVAPRPDDRPPPRTRLIMPLEDVIFPSAGRYEFAITAKGRTLSGPILYLMRSSESTS